MTVRLAPLAADDLARIGDYLMRRSPSGAANVRSPIQSTLTIIERYPGAGRLQTIPDVRKLCVARYPYVIYYFTDPASREIVVLRVYHAAQERDFEDA
jgi:toxin ParE1/3/4